MSRLVSSAVECVCVYVCLFGAVPSSVSAVVDVAVSGEGGDEKLEGVGAFIMATTMFLRLMQAETRVMTQIIPSSHHAAALDDLTKGPIEFFMRDGEVSVCVWLKPDSQYHAGAYVRSVSSV